MKKIILLSIFLFGFFALFPLNNANQVLALTCSGTSGPSCNGTTCEYKANTLSNSTTVCGGAANTPCCVYEWDGGGSGCPNNCQPTAAPTAPPTCSNSTCPYCTFCATSSGPCTPYTNGCPGGGSTPTPIPPGGCPSGQTNPYNQCSFTSNGNTLTASCISNPIGCSVSQCNSASDCKFCGDGVCSSGSPYYETCSSCPQDCGVCPGSSSTPTLGSAPTSGPTPTPINSVSGSIINLNFGLSNQSPWIQSTGSDIRVDGGFTDPIPAGASCGPYASVNGSGNTPGVIYSGNGTADYGSGGASQNPPNGWSVGGLTYPETFTPVAPNVIRTSYNYITSLLNQNGQTVTPITASMFTSTLATGAYISNGDLTLTGSGYTFPTGSNYVILVNGNLTIDEELLVPNGSTVFFTVSGNITVTNNVGAGNSISTICKPSATLGGVSTGCDLEGYYSSDHSFTVQGGNVCPTPDSRINVAGAIVVNAALDPSNPGSFIDQRDLCAGDTSCPVFSITERPDFILNSPFFMLNSRRIYQELAP